jgi:flagellar motor switch protein FliN/FliY
MSQAAGGAAAELPPDDPTEVAPAPASPAPPRFSLERLPHRAFLSLPVEIVVSVGSARPPLGELLGMDRDAVIVLDRRIDDPVDIRVGDRVIARGELQELDDGSGRLGVRLTEVIDHDLGS